MYMKNNFHNVLKELRAEHKKTQTEIANDLNISQRAYSYYETGESEPPLDLLIDFAEYYKVSLDFLMGRYEARSKRNTIQMQQKPVGIQVARTTDGTSHKRPVTAEEMKEVEELPNATDF